MTDQPDSQLSLGSKLNIISKSGIRYEGTLLSIDPVQESIALQNVRAYGTENRPVNKFQPPKDEIFECIVFKALDLMDLSLSSDQETLPGEASNCTQDPAIISSTTKIPSSVDPNSNTSTPTYPLPDSMNPSLGATGSSLLSSGDGVVHSKPKHVSFSRPADYNSPGNYDNRDQRNTFASRHGRGGTRFSGNWSRSPRNSAQPTTNTTVTATANKTVSFNQEFDFEEANNRFKKDEICEEFRKKLKLLTLNQPEVTSPSPLSHTEDKFKLSSTSIIIKEDNTEVKSSETTGLSSAEGDNTPSKTYEVEPGEIRSEDDSGDSGVEIPIYYDQAKSFFDSISTENPANKRGSLREEKSLNTQTFGEEGSISSSQSNRRVMRGRNTNRGIRRNYYNGGSYSTGWTNYGSNNNGYYQQEYWGGPPREYNNRPPREHNNNINRAPREHVNGPAREYSNYYYPTYNTGRGRSYNTSRGGYRTPEDSSSNYQSQYSNYCPPHEYSYTEYQHKSADYYNGPPSQSNQYYGNKRNYNSYQNTAPPRPREEMSPNYVQTKTFRNSRYTGPPTGYTRGGRDHSN